MKQLFYLILLLLSSVTFAQDHLEDDETKLIFTEFGDGIPSEIRNSFSNFDQNTNFGAQVEGLLEKPYLTTNAQQSIVKIELENIGRLVLYAKLFNKRDSILFNTIHKRRGSITIIPYRNNLPLEDIASETYDFGDDIFQQIHFNINRAGVNKIEIIFNTMEDLFIVEKLKVIPLNEGGIEYYKELERIEKSILDMTVNLENSANVLKLKNIDQLSKIEVLHKNLSQLITGNSFESVATEKASSLNPFKNGAFLDHYTSVLDKANESEREKIKKVSKDLGRSDFTNVAMTIGNLYTGGSFSSLINLVGGIFEKSIKLDNQNELLKIGSDFYSQASASGSKLKLVKVSDESRQKIDKAVAENAAFKTYITKITGFIQEDMETMGELKKDIGIAKIIRDDLEALTWEIIKPYTKESRASFIQDSKVKFVDLAVLIERGFETDTMHLEAFREARSRSITTIEKFNDLATKYDRTTSKIKTHYDIMYDTRPKERSNSFNDLAETLPPKMVLDWNEGQQKISDEYRKEDGLRSFLASATGKE